MKRTLWIALLALGLASSIEAQTFDPKVAYTRAGGNSTSLVLANEDGSGAVSVYTSKKALGPIDFRPGGGQIAFAEQGFLKVLNYTPTATGVSVGSVVSLQTTDTRPDYSPDGSSLIYVASSIYGKEIRKIPAAGGTPQTLIYGDLGYAFTPLDLAWMRDGYRFVYLNNPYPGTTYEIRLVTLGPDRSSVVSDNVLLSTDSSGLGFGNIWGLDTARTRDSVLFTAGYPAGSPVPVRTLEVNLADNSVSYYPAMFSGRFSADDSRILNIDINRSYLQSYVIATGQTTRLTKRGSFGWVDARPDAGP